MPKTINLNKCFVRENFDFGLGSKFTMLCKADGY